MQITYRQYPYPVLKFFENDYKNSEFNSEFNYKIENNNMKLELKFALKSKFLKGLINEKKAAYVVHVECAGTRYRRIFESFTDSLEALIDGKEISGDVEVCVLIVAKTEIPDFESSEFNSDFKGISFNIEVGDVLAVGESLKISIEKTGDSLRKVPSIFSILPIDDPKKDGDWTHQGNKILITLNRENYNKYRSISKDVNFRGAVAMMVVIPVITEIISKIQGDFDYFEDEEWFRVINRRLEALKINEDNIKSSSASCIAYRVLEGVLTDSFTNIIEFLLGGED